MIECVECGPDCSGMSSEMCREGFYSDFDSDDNLALSAGRREGFQSFVRAVRILLIIGEFDPGSGRTLAACLTHVSRTGLGGQLSSSVADGCVTREKPVHRWGIAGPTAG